MQQDGIILECVIETFRDVRPFRVCFEIRQRINRRENDKIFIFTFCSDTDGGDWDDGYWHCVRARVVLCLVVFILTTVFLTIECPAVVVPAIESIFTVV